MVTPVNQGPPAPLDDIPEALRDPLSRSTTPGSGAIRWQRWLGLSGLAVIALGTVGGAIATRTQFLTTPAADEAIAPIRFDGGTGSAAIAGIRRFFFPMGGEIAPTATDQLSLLGHRYYPEASPDMLVSLTADGRLKLRPAAAARVQRMLAQARADGVNLQAVSGFRSEDEQRHLFFGLSAQRAELPTQRAEVSAPPGYSEHHTGYAVDFVDGYYPDTDLEVGFENTPAFRWLQANAVRYGFELSFPKNNDQGVSYEPWHWRFVGDRDSLETFYQDP